MKFGLLGEKLAHSYSPIIHNYVFEKLNINATYELIETPVEGLKHYINELRNGVYNGFNVTIPYKKTIMSLLDEIDEKALKIGSVNTVYVKDNKVIGTNTDYDGFLKTLEYYNVEVLNKSCYILGTGGASLAISAVLKDLGGNVTFVSRNPKENIISYNELENKDIDILVNTTPVGMYPNIDQCPVSLNVINNSKVVMDIIFNPKITKLLEYAKSNINGLYMLVLQAIKAEEIWQNQSINLEINELLTRM